MTKLSEDDPFLREVAARGIGDAVQDARMMRRLGDNAIGGGIAALVAIIAGLVFEYTILTNAAGAALASMSILCMYAHIKYQQHIMEVTIYLIETHTRTLLKQQPTI